MSDPWLTAKVGDILIWEGKDSGTATFRKVKILTIHGGRLFSCEDIQRDDGKLETHDEFFPTDDGWRFAEHLQVQKILTFYNE